jgi:hypothetical protein
VLPLRHVAAGHPLRNTQPKASRADVGTNEEPTPPADRHSRGSSRRFDHLWRMKLHGSRGPGLVRVVPGRRVQRHDPFAEVVSGRQRRGKRRRGPIAFYATSGLGSVRPLNRLPPSRQLVSECRVDSGNAAKARCQDMAFSGKRWSPQQDGRKRYSVVLDRRAVFRDMPPRLASGTSWLD